VGIKCKDGVVLVYFISFFLFLWSIAVVSCGQFEIFSKVWQVKFLKLHDFLGYLLQGVEKLIPSKMLLEGSNRRIHAVHKHAGMVSSHAIQVTGRLYAYFMSFCCQIFLFKSKVCSAMVLHGWDMATREEWPYALL
jgi:hypothetical protein